MEIRILSNDESLVRTLAGTASQALKSHVGEPNFIPGAAESWWQLLVDIGVIGLPLGVTGNLIASWIWEAVHKPAEAPITALNLSQPRKVKLVLSGSARPVEVEIQSDDLDALRASVESALKPADIER